MTMVIIIIIIQIINQPMYTSGDQVLSKHSAGSGKHICDVQKEYWENGTSPGRHGNTTDVTALECGPHSETVCSLPVHY